MSDVTHYITISMCNFSAPESPPTNISLNNSIEYSIAVHWSPPRRPNGVITHYTLYISYENGVVDLFTTDGQSTSYIITNLLPYQHISVEVSASTRIGEGPRSSDMEIRAAQARTYIVT